MLRPQRSAGRRARPVGSQRPGFLFLAETIWGAHLPFTLWPSGGGSSQSFQSCCCCGQNHRLALPRLAPSSGLGCLCKLGIPVKAQALGGPQPRGGIPSAPGPWGEREGHPGRRQSGVPGAQPAALPEKEIALRPWLWRLGRQERSLGGGSAWLLGWCVFVGEAHCASEVHLAVAAEQVGFLPRMDIPAVPA